MFLNIVLNTACMDNIIMIIMGDDDNNVIYFVNLINIDDGLMIMIMN